MPTSAHNTLSSYLIPLAVGLLCGILFVFSLGNLPFKWTFAILLGVIGVGGLVFLNILQLQTKHMILMLAVYLMPILYDINFMYDENPGFYVHANGFGVAITDVLFGMLIVAWLLQITVGKRGNLPDSTFPLEWKIVMAGLFVVNFVSAVNTAEPFFAYSMIWQQIKVYFIIVFLAKTINDIQVVKRIGYIMVAVLGTQAIILFEQKLVGAIFTDQLLGQRTTWQNEGGPLRVSGTLGQPNACAMFMNQLMMVGVFIGLAEKKFGLKVLILGAVAMAAAAEIFTASRGGWSGLAISFVTCMILWRIRQGHGFVASVALVSLIGSLMFSGLFMGSEAFRNRLTQDDKGTSDVRAPLMEVAKNLIADNPLTGVGLNHYTYDMQKYDRTFVAITRDWSAPVHNTFMLIAGEIGIPATIFPVLMIWFTMYASIRLFFKADGTISAMSLGIFGGVLSWVIHNQVDPTSIYAEYPFWIMSGMVIAMQRMHRTQEREKLRSAAEEKAAAVNTVT